MAWQVEIHKLVLSEDFKRISRSDLEMILKTIGRKLGTDPEGYGERLKAGLKGFWKLKISGYRVIYRIENKAVRVLVIKIGFRRGDEVYQSMPSRMRKADGKKKKSRIHLFAVADSSSSPFCYFHTESGSNCLCHFR